MVLLWEIYHRGSNPRDRGLPAGYSAPIAPNFWCNSKTINPFTSVNMCTHFICDTFMLFKYEILSTVFRLFHFSWVMVMKSAAFDHLKHTCFLRWMGIDQENLMSLLHDFITCQLGFQSIWIKAQRHLWNQWRSRLLRYGLTSHQHRFLCDAGEDPLKLWCACSCMFASIFDMHWKSNAERQFPVTTETLCSCSTLSMKRQTVMSPLNIKPLLLKAWII